MTHTAASSQPMVEQSIICVANSNFVADSNFFSGNHIYRQLLSLKLSRIQNITLKNNYAKYCGLLRSMLTCCKHNLVETTGHFLLWFSFILALWSLTLSLHRIWCMHSLSWCHSNKLFVFLENSRHLAQGLHCNCLLTLLILSFSGIPRYLLV